MKVPLKWLKDYVDIDVSPREFAEGLTMSGSKVETVETLGEEIKNVVVGKITNVEKHPNADKLLVAQVDIGAGSLQIITGASNIKEGDFVPVALDGALLPGGRQIKKGKLRGLMSEGMMCSIDELGLTKHDYPEADEDGIFILSDEYVPGTDIKEVLGMNDVVAEFEITSNRPDCLSILGIARETAATFKKTFRLPEISLKENADNAAGYISVEIKDTDFCSRYAARIVKNVKIGPSPKWIKDRLRAAGIRPINNIVDITNYVMLEYGQPMHAFDLKNIKGNKIIVRRAYEGEIIKTLDDNERVLDSTMLVIADEERAVAVAGVMGGANSEISNDTSEILFESANFNATGVRLAAKKLGMRTEASSRFEKGLDPENVIAALDRAVQLVEILGAGDVCKGIVDCYPVKPQKREIPFRPAKINSFLGTDISTEEMVQILKMLDFEINEEDMIIKVPSFRMDVEVEADIAEEIARFYGYNNIPPSLLEGKAPTLGRKTYKQKIEDIIKQTMISCGLSEAYTYSFTSPKVFDRLRLPEESMLRKAVVISNPLGEDYSIMRTTTIPEMLDILSRNHNRRAKKAHVFELAYTYMPVEHNALPIEKQVLTIGMYGEADFFDLKGVIEELLDQLGIVNAEFIPETNHPTFHPGRTANLVVNGSYAGILGQIHPDVAANFEAPEDSFLAAIEFNNLAEASSLKVQYKPLPKFPSVTRDLAMLVYESVHVKDIEIIIKAMAGRILEELELFDVYKGKQVPEGMKSVAYSLTFRASDRTLTDEEVNKAMSKVLDGLKKHIGAELRS